MEPDKDDIRYRGYLIKFKINAKKPDITKINEFIRITDTVSEEFLLWSCNVPKREENLLMYNIKS